MWPIFHMARKSKRRMSCNIQNFCDYISHGMRDQPQFQTYVQEICHYKETVLVCTLPLVVYSDFNHLFSKTLGTSSYLFLLLMQIRNLYYASSGLWSDNDDERLAQATPLRLIP